MKLTKDIVTVPMANTYRVRLFDELRLLRITSELLGGFNRSAHHTVSQH
jgi:hypothetical protein